MTDHPPSKARPDSSAVAPAVLAGLPGVAGAAAATCGTACAGACAPPLLGLLGLSGSSALVGSWTAWMRPVFLAVSLVSLALAFHRAYRRPRPGEGARRRFHESRTFVWMMAALCLVLYLFPPGSRADQPSASSPCAQQPCPLKRSAATPNAPPCPG